MRYFVLAIIFVTFFTACNSKDETEKTKKTVVKKEPIIKEYGFTFNDYKVVRDTIRSGDTFGKILEKFPLKDSLRIYDLTKKVKDSFNCKKVGEFSTKILECKIRFGTKRRSLLKTATKNGGVETK